MLDFNQIFLLSVTKYFYPSSFTMEIFLNLIKRTLKKREEIILSGFGTFTLVKRKARIGRNPKTGDKIKIAARVLPKFKAARALKEAVK